MRGRKSAIGKKEQRQIDQKLMKAARGESTGKTDVEANTVPKQHKLRLGKGK